MPLIVQIQWSKVLITFGNWPDTSLSFSSFLTSLNFKFSQPKPKCHKFGSDCVAIFESNTGCVFFFFVIYNNFFIVIRKMCVTKCLHNIVIDNENLLSITKKKNSSNYYLQILHFTTTQVSCKSHIRVLHPSQLYEIFSMPPLLVTSLLIQE